MNSKTIDLIHNDVNANGYTVAPGQTLEIILEGGGAYGHGWDYDDTIGNGLYSVDYTYEQYGPDNGCPVGNLGCRGKEIFEITAGAEEGDATFFTCWVEKWIETVKYSEMSKTQRNRNCKEIKINVEKA